MNRRLLHIFSTAAVILTLTAVSVSAQNITSKQNEKARLEKEIAQIDKMLSSNKSRNSNALNDLALVQKKISNRRALIAASDREIARLEQEIAVAKRDAGQLSSRLDTLETYYNRLILGAYKNRDASLQYAWIFSSESLSQAYRRYGYFRNITESLNTQAEQIKKARKDLEDHQQTLIALRDEEAKVRSAKELELKKLAKEEKQYQQTINSLKKDRKKYETQLKKKKQQVEALNNEIRKMIAASKKKSSSGSAKKKNTSFAKENAAFEASKGGLQWPVEGPVIETFGQKTKHPVTNVTLPPSNGISIAVKENTPVKAVFDGVVANIVVMPGFNECILVQHGDYYTFYGKLKTVNVKIGEKIKAGHILGTVDTIYGSSEFVFQVWLQDAPQNPLKWLSSK